MSEFMIDCSDPVAARAWAAVDLLYALSDIEDEGIRAIGRELAQAVLETIRDEIKVKGSGRLRTVPGGKPPGE